MKVNMATNRPVDRTFLSLTLILLALGFFIFLSASLGLLAQDGSIFSRVAIKQMVIGIILGIPCMLLVSRIYYKKWRPYAMHLFLLSLLLTALTYVDALSLTSGGASRWLSLGNLSFQPAELLKLGMVLYIAAWFASVGSKVRTISYGFAPLTCIVLLASLTLAFQPDNGTILVLISTAAIMFAVAGGRYAHLFILFIMILMLGSIVAYKQPYIMQRITTFINPESDPQGASYQMRQALIAVGSGGMTGRGFGQSVQKFNYLPEPTSDSIFAVAAEEFGFLGSGSIVLLFVAFTLRGLWLAARAPDAFARLATTGLVILIAAQSFFNIAAILGIMPLSGMPLLFISHGGTALLFALIEVGIILNISRYRL